ncbi:hypothetical protein [Actinoplanes auranticolor]|nr:hypothetical protein [Actinoplanes auranticolor]
MASQSGDVRAWLRTRPSLDQLCERWPAEWAAVEAEISELTERGDIEELKAHVAAVAAPQAARGRSGNPQMQVRLEVRRQMMVAALKQVSLATAAGVRRGRMRFNLVNGWVAQKLLFARELERKPVPMTWFRTLWPLLWQRRRLMPLVSSKGIYCFYSDRLIAELAALIGERDTLEIAAGDGTLSRFLADAGVRITATDDHSWKHAVSFPADVRRQDARTALRAHRPQAVVCSWPPAGNSFERHVFATPSVQLYIVLGSRHEFATGDRAAYTGQDRFLMAEQPELGRLVLPPEIDPQVLVFRRHDGS